MADKPDRLWLPYAALVGTPAPLVATQTRGARIRLADGRELIDGVSSWWTACHGYNHPHITAALTRQLDDMPHVMFGGLVHAPAMALARRLCAILPGAPERVFFSDSGSVAVEVAMKMAVQYWRNRAAGREGGRRTRFVSFLGGYHGDTMAAMSVTDPEDGMHRAFAGYVPQQFVVPLPTDDAAAAALERLLASRSDEIAAVIVEPLVQAAGGMRFHSAGCLAALRDACRRHDVLVIADEIATGFGRTGAMFACTEASLEPDIVCVGKALTGGAIGLAATAANRRVVEAFMSDDPDRALMHGPTYMANPLACAAANASLDLFETEPRLDQVAAIARHLETALAPCRDIAGVVEMRVKGAIGVVQLAAPGDAGWLRTRLVEKGVWVRPFGDVIYLMPPFVVDDDELVRLTDAVVEVTREWAVRNGG